MQSTIAISPETKQLLAAVKVHPRESYEDAIKRLLERQRSGLEAKPAADSGL